MSSLSICTAEAGDAAADGVGLELEEGRVLDEAAPGVGLTAGEVARIAEEQSRLPQGVPGDQGVGPVEPHDVYLLLRERGLEVGQEA